MAKFLLWLILLVVCWPLALLALVLFLASSFIVYNKGLFGARPKAGPEMPVTAETTFQAR